MLTAAATWYIDADKTWAVSALNRYEFNTEQRNTDITPGQAYTLEWGASKTLFKTLDVGAIGYYQQQVTTDSGAGSTAQRWRSPTRMHGLSGLCFEPANLTAPPAEGPATEIARRRRNELHRSDRRATSLTFIEAIVAYQL